jgi:hypothetical protein
LDARLTLLCKIELLLNSYRFAALEIIESEVDLNSAWETVKKNIKIVAIEGVCY